MCHLAESYIQNIYRRGNIGPVSNTVMLDNRIILGLRASHKASRMVRLEYFWVTPSLRGGGAGSAAIRMLTHDADCFGITLDLRPEPFDRRPGDRSLPATKLREWYAQFGFVPRGDLYMEYRPRNPSDKPWWASKGDVGPEVQAPCTDPIRDPIC